MTQFVIANNVNTQLAAAASSGATTLTLASSTNLPTLSAGQIMPLTLNDAATGQNYEIVYVTAISGVTLTVTRAQEGTGALNWSIGDYAYCAPTAGTVAMTSGNPNDTFQVAASTALTHAPQTGQVQGSAFNYAGLAGGTANAITATLSPAPASYTDYLMVTVRIAATNTGSVSLNVNGLGVVPVIGLGHQLLQGGELFAGGFATFAYSTNYSEAILLECTGGALQIAPATQSQHALQAGQALGLYLGTQIIDSSQTVNPGTYTVAGRSVTATKWRVRGVGGGGAGGGAAATASNTISLGTGGQSGAYCEFYMAAASTSATIGAGGTPGSGASGGAGGNSSFGSLATCPGGAGGSVAGPAVAPFSQVTSGGTGNPTGTATFVVSMAGSLVGTPVSPGANGALISGYGGGCALGTGGNATIGSAGGGGTGKGSGGSGAANGPSVSATAGGAGAPGIWIVDEFA